LLFGVASSIWVALWSRMLDWVTRATLPPDLRDAPENPLRDVGLIERVLVEIAGVDLGRQRVAVLLASWILFSTIVGAAWSYLRMDPKHHAREAFRWALRRTGVPALAIAVAVSACLAVGVLMPAGEFLLAFPLLLAVVAVFGIPLSVLRPEFASGSDRRWWRPRWPGGRVLVGVIAVFAALWLVELGFDALVDRVPAAGPIVFLPWLVLSMLGVALTAHLLVERLSPERGIECLRRLVQERASAGPWLTLLLAFGLAAVWISIPMAFAYLWIWKAVPVAAQLASTRQMEPPSLAQWTIDAFNLIGRFGMAGLLIPIVLLIDASRARLVHLIAESRPHSLAAATTSTAQDPGGSLSPEGRL
jgi:hypothetical protein